MKAAISLGFAPGQLHIITECLFRGEVRQEDWAYAKLFFISSPPACSGGLSTSPLSGRGPGSGHLCGAVAASTKVPHSALPGHALGIGASYLLPKSWITCSGLR